MNEVPNAEMINNSFSNLSVKDERKCCDKNGVSTVVDRNSITSSDGTKNKMAPSGTDVSFGKAKKHMEKFTKAYEKWKAGKSVLNMVVVGHVDAGKSTLMGNLLFQVGEVDKKVMHKYKQESQKIGKASFAYAWVLDEDQEERNRGVTIDVAQRRFETTNKVVNLIDAPGHKDFVPNMIIGASLADFAVLVINATKGEFESGLESGGQTREHTILLKSLGLAQIIVAINKMDTVDWSKERFDEIKSKMVTFLKSIGFREHCFCFIPCSGLLGQNLVEPLKDVGTWYTGSTLLETIDQIEPPSRMAQSSLRFCIADVFKDNRSGFCVSGRIESGALSCGDSVLVMPSGASATIKGITVEDSVEYAFPGELPIVVLSGIDQKAVSIGSVICDPSDPIPVTSRFKAKVIVFGKIAIVKGMSVIFFNKTTNEPAIIKRIDSQLDKTGATVAKSRPRFLTKGMSGIVEILLTDKEICIELFSKNRELSRFMLRYSGDTIASGVVQEIITKTLK